MPDAAREDAPAQALVVACPHCGDPVLIQSIGCGDFVHGATRAGKPIGAHASAKSRAKHARNPSALGCGGAFRLAAGGAPVKAQPNCAFRKAKRGGG